MVSSTIGTMANMMTTSFINSAIDGGTAFSGVTQMGDIWNVSLIELERSVVKDILMVKIKIKMELRF
jgi:hypothetical protein